MELLQSATEYLIVDGEQCLRCSRSTGILEAANAVAIAEQTDPTCLGRIYGVVGRVEFTSTGPSYLILIKERKQVASHPLKGDPIYKIEKVVAIPLTTIDSSTIVNGNGNFISDLQLPPCPKHQFGHRTNGETSNSIKPGVVAGFSLLQKGQKKMAKATADSLKFVTTKINVRGIAGGGQKINQIDLDEKERSRIERRLVLEFLRMFNESDSFYYCPTADITNSIQRLSNQKDFTTNRMSSFNFDNFDQRFIWNFYMLRDLIKQSETSSSSMAVDRWIVPIIQGFVGVENCSIILGDDLNRTPSRPSTPETFQFRLMLISRRSIHRAGTRYIKRGIDCDGHCANYVETEQILLVGDYGDHAVAFVQVRGSVPVYWSQPGYKYKPPPKLDRPKTESTLAFRKHFVEELELYSNMIVVNLVEQNGKEKVLSDAFIDHVLDFDSENVTYVSFDFHEHCRGLKFENVAILTLAMEEYLTQSRFCWIDKSELNCAQNGIFRINCVDCLDRTNVVQSSLARYMFEMQLRKFGLLPPEVNLPTNCVQSFQTLWASNGDAISRQYTGTAALKGDFTRTGTRNFAGLMKDGYNSANRYYLCHMKDARRQAVIDAFLGRRTYENDQELENLIQSKIESGGDEDEQSWLKEKDEQLRLFVRDCERLVVPDGEVILGGWAFINADPGTGDETEEDMDTCVILTRHAYYVADYDEDMDKFVDIQRVQLIDVQKIEAGPMTVASVLGVPKTKATCLRIYYKIDDGGKEEYFHVWRSGSTRLFNNLAIAIKNRDEADEYMKAIAEQFRVALELISRRLSVGHPSKLERRRSKLPPSKLVSRRHANIFGTPPVFFTSLSGGMKSFGSRFSAAFTNQGHQGMKLFRLSSGRRHNANDGYRIDQHGHSPLVKLQEPIENIDPRLQKKFDGPMFSKEAGLLFGIYTIRKESTEVKNRFLRRSKSEIDINSNKNPSDLLVQLESPGELLLPDLYSYSPVENGSTANLHPTINSGASLLVPNKFSNTIVAANHSLMKTSHSETSFKPQIDSSLDVLQSGQRTLAISQTALDKTTSNSGLKFPILFKKKTDEGGSGNLVSERKKFPQFQEKIQKSKTKFLIL